MADDETEDNEYFDISKLSEAEKRRLRRRQRILDNQGARLNRILKDDPNNPEKAAEKNVTNEAVSVPKSTVESSQPVKVDRGKSIKDKNSDDESEPLIDSRQQPKQTTGNSERRPPSVVESLFQEFSGEVGTQDSTTREQARNTTEPRFEVKSDGTVILPKLGDIYGRVLICLLALFLSIFNAKRYLITFMSWEVAYYFINGLPTMPPPNMVMVLAAVMGLHENQLNRFKKILHFSNCVLIDFSLFLVFTLLPHFVRNVL